MVSYYPVVGRRYNEKIDAVMFAILTLGVIGLVTAPMNSLAFHGTAYCEDATILGTAGRSETCEGTNPFPMDYLNHCKIAVTIAHVFYL